MASNAQHCSFVLLAEFDIDRGAQLTYQFPQPLGTDEGYVYLQDSYAFSQLICIEIRRHAMTRLLANLMLPDGAEKQLERFGPFSSSTKPHSTRLLQSSHWKRLNQMGGEAVKILPIDQSCCTC